MDQGMWGHTGWGRGPTMALMPGARDPSWRNNSWGARVGHAPDQDSPGPGKQRGHQASRGLAQRGHGGSPAHSQLHLLPGLIIPRPADHTPTLTWFLTSTDLQPSQPAAGESLAMQLGTSGILQGGPLPRATRTAPLHTENSLRRVHPRSNGFPSHSPPNKLLFIP